MGRPQSWSGRYGEEKNVAFAGNTDWTVSAHNIFIRQQKGM
jgi:hypothetical protein